MKKLFVLFISLCIVLFSFAANADEIIAGGNRIEYDSVEQLQEIYAAVKERMGSEYKTILFDADTYESASFIIGETFPAGRYYVYPVVVSENNISKLCEVRIWEKDKINESRSYDVVYALHSETLELTDGMKIQLHWDYDERGVFIAMHKLPDKLDLMDAFD